MSVSISPGHGLRPGRHRTTASVETERGGVVASITIRARYSAIRLAGPAFGAIAPSSPKKCFRSVTQVSPIVCDRLFQSATSSVTMIRPVSALTPKLSRCCQAIGLKCKVRPRHQKLALPGGALSMLVKPLGSGASPPVDRPSPDNSGKRNTQVPLPYSSCPCSCPSILLLPFGSPGYHKKDRQR